MSTNKSKPKNHVTSEVDAIKATNSRKGFIYGNDAVPVSEGGLVTNKDSADEPVISEEEENLLTFSKDQLQQMMAGAVKAETKKYENLLKQKDDAIAAEREQREQDRTKADQEKDSLEKKVRSEQKQKDTITKLLSDFGYSGESDSNSAYIAPLSMRQQGLSAKDALREFNSIYNDNARINPKSVINPETSEAHTQFDSRPLRRFIKKHREELRDAVEGELKKRGFLRGQVSDLGGRDTPTSLTTLPPMLQTYLSEVTRMEHSARFVLWQLPNRSIATGGIPPGQTALVSRVRDIEEGTTSSDWELTPGVELTTDNQPLQGNGIRVVIRENGLGKNSTPVIMRPVAIPDFWMANSLMDLERILQDRLGKNYHKFEDISIFEMLISTTAVVYNNRNDVITSPADVATGGGGQLTVQFLSSLYSYMDMLQIPTYRDGKYAYVCPSTHVAQLRNSMQPQHQYFDQVSVEEVTNTLTRSNANEDMGRVSGYVGTVSGFHIFSGNSFSRGTAGTPGVQSESLGAGTRLTRTAFAMGADATAWATAMPMQIREEVGRFQRLREFSWVSHEGFAALDVDPNSTTPASDQQLRVLEVRMTDQEV